MPTFRDTCGRDWLVTLNVAQVKRVREALNINLADLQDGDLLSRLNDPVTLVDVLYVLCREQADNANVTDVQFASGLGGDALADATQAMLEALIVFFPNPATRLILRVALVESNSRIERAMDAMRVLDEPSEKKTETGDSSSPSPAA